MFPYFKILIYISRMTFKPIILCIFILFFAFTFDAKAQKLVNQWQDNPSDLLIPTEEQLFKNDPDPAILSAQINVRLKKIQRTIPLDYNAHVQKYIDFYTSKSTHIAKVLGRAEKFFPIFEPIFNEYGVPDEMKYLAVVESALNPFARSPVGATGPWQFMHGTGLQYGLAINKRIDERKDPYKSCDAAARYLKYMYNIYGNWHLAIAAYNCGPGNVNKAINKAGGSKNYWDIKPYLPKETQAYVPSYIAIVYAMKYAKNMGISPSPLYRENTQRITLKDKLTVQDLTKIVGIDKALIIEENPSLLTTLIPANFTINLPASKMVAFNYYQDSLYAFAENVNVGDKLSTPNVVKPSADNTKSFSSEDIPKEKVEKPKKKTKQEIAKEKKLAEQEKLSAKKKLIEEEKKLAEQKKKEKQSVKQEPTKEEYLKQKREELKQKNATAPIVQQNNLSKLQVANTQKIETPDFYKEDDANYRTIVYTVMQGDNLGFIAKWFHVKVSEIRRWNELSGNLLKVNQELVLYVHEKDYTHFVHFNFLSFRLKNILSDDIQTQEELLALKNKKEEKKSEPLSTKLNPINYFRDEDCFEMYKIKSGETLWTIAQKYDEVSVQDLINWNDFDKKPILKPGQEIKVRKKPCK